MSYVLHLDVFEGPMDLLLYLVKKNNMDVMDIAVSDITREYIAYLDMLQKLNLDSAGEFLVMAATLMQIKARMLVPQPEKVEEEGPDPRAELVAKLLEYQKYKEAANVLSEKYVVQREVYYRQEPQFSQDEYILEANIFDLLGAFRNILARAKEEVKEILYEDIPIETKIREILTALEHKEYMTFEELFSEETGKADLIAAFLALLELIRTKQITARQAKVFSNVRIYRVKPSTEDSAEEQRNDNDNKDRELTT